MDILRFAHSLLLVNAGAGLEIVWNSSEGGVVHLPNGASHIRAPPALFRDYVIRHAQSWYDFVNDNLCRGVPPGSLYLVTACDKSDSWMVSAFSEAASGRSVSLNVGVLGFGQGGLSYSYSWENIHAPTYRTGPRSTTPTGMIANNGGNENTTDDPNRNAPQGRNQCIFSEHCSLLLIRSRK